MSPKCCSYSFLPTFVTLGSCTLNSLSQLGWTLPGEAAELRHCPQQDSTQWDHPFPSAGKNELRLWTPEFTHLLALHCDIFYGL